MLAVFVQNFEEFDKATFTGRSDNKFCSKYTNMVVVLHLRFMGSPKLLSNFVYVIVEKSYNGLKVFLVMSFPNFYAWRTSVG